MAEIGMYLGEARWFAETTDPAVKTLLRAGADEAREIRATETLAAARRLANELHD